MKKIIYLFTAEYPFGKSESFIENEIDVLENKFDTVFIYPFASSGTEQRSIPNNGFIQITDNTRPGLNSKTIFLRNLFFICSVHAGELLHCSKPFYYLQNIRYFNSLLIRGIYDVGKIKKLMKHRPEEIIFHSYWMNDWALALAVLKKKKEIPHFVFRCGGFDIYDERHKGGFLPFRYFVYQQCDAIYPNSAFTLNYIKAKNCFAEKVKLQYLGTKDEGLNPFDPNAEFTIVSCSNVLPLKRVDLIVEILKNIDFKISWIHFGDGNSMQEIKEKAVHLPANINVEFKGRVTNKAVIGFYKAYSVNLFITVSETESLPVSIQEAISFGIPILATHVGGMAEIVNAQTGFLIDKRVEIKQTAKLITDFRVSDKNTVSFRKGVRECWLAHFDATKIYSQFYDELINS